jgi:hypothetical protein
MECADYLDIELAGPCILRRAYAVEIVMVVVVMRAYDFICNEPVIFKTRN